MLTAVVCDDDDVMRGVVRDLAEERGLKVLAETDYGYDVVDLVRRFSVDVVLLDLVLPDLRGEDVLLRMQSEGLRPTIIVFSGYDADESRLKSLGVHTFVRKPDLNALGYVLSDLVPKTADDPSAQAAPRAAVDDRRHPRRHVHVDEPEWRSPSGVEPASTLNRHLATCATGDTIMAIAVDGYESITGRYGDVLAHDCLLEVARAFSSTLRTQDSLIEEPMSNGLVLVLRAGDERAATAAWNRAQAKLASVGAQTSARATWVTVVGTAGEARARAVGAVLSSPAGMLSQG